MKNKHPYLRTYLLIIFCACALLLLVGGSNLFERTSTAQSGAGIVLLSESTSTRAIALESVTRVKEPFALTAPVPFSADNRTRVMIFAMNLHIETGEDISDVTADAQDGAGRIYPLSIENIRPVPGQEWISAVTVRLSDDLGSVGDVLVRLNHRGIASNRVRVAIGQVGGGPPDDLGSGPTPAPVFQPAQVAPTPNTNVITAGALTADDVRTIIAQAVSAAVALNRAVTVMVVDREGNILGSFRMTGAPLTTRVSGGGRVGEGLEGVNAPALDAANSKASTCAYFSTFGNAFTPRTAGFIIQEHLPPGIDQQAAGPLYGVQYSSLRCTDVKGPYGATLPLGLSADPGAMPLYKNGIPSGGVGIEGDGIYTVDKDPRDFDKPVEELIAVAAGRGYAPPARIQGDNILVNGIRLPYLNTQDADAPRPATIAFANLPGTVIDPIRGAQPSNFVPASVPGSSGTADTRFFPPIASPSTSANRLTAAEVMRILGQAARQADITRAAIRQPLGSPARVNITVVDVNGEVLGIFRTQDAPVFGFDVSSQKARSALLFSRADGGALIRAANGAQPIPAAGLLGSNVASYVDRANADGLRLDGSIAFSSRGMGFLHRPFLPEGINLTPPGPLSKGLPDWSVFNVGLQLDLVRDRIALGLRTATDAIPPRDSVGRCSNIPVLGSGLQIFAGGQPLFKNGELVGAIGISGDGIDQDDIIDTAGAEGFLAPVNIRSDQFFVRGVRLPYVKFPRSPNL